MADRNRKNKRGAQGNQAYAPPMQAPSGGIMTD